MSKNEDIKTYQNFINGQWVAPSSGEYYQVSNPAVKDEVVGKFPLSTPADVDKAVTAAHERFQEWKNVPASKREEYIRRFAQVLDENKERLALAATQEQGKIYKEALGEPARGVTESLYVAGEAVRLEGIVRPSDSIGLTNVLERVPIGVVAAISPWNFPVLNPIRKIVPALTAGCTVVFKPATSTPLTGVILAELFEKAGFPPGTVNLVIGSGGKIGDALVGNPLVKGITFTGSTKVGRHINQIAAVNFTKMQMEMGGKNAVIVADCNNLEKVAGQIVNAAFINAGQRCTSISRLIVLAKHADEIEKFVVAKAKQIKVGNGMDPQSTMGPVINQDALETIAAYIDFAVKEGAKIIFGGKKLTGGVYDQGYYFEPTIITNVTPQMKVAREEIFGPVLTIHRVDSFAEALDVCNDTEYGLTATLCTENMEYCYDFIHKIECGMVRVNNLGSSAAHMPFGGTKLSGLGPFSIGSTNMDFYTNSKVIYTQYK
jgi:acyl-CoA reductase-like NAD-dependent aldehyde dehydrogenase